MAVVPVANYSPPSNTNVYVPSSGGRGSANLIIDFARNPKKFSLNKYVFIQTVEREIGYYPRMLASDYVRLAYADGRDNLWADGAYRFPSQRQMQAGRHAFDRYETIRYDFGETIGYRLLKQASWDEQQRVQGKLASLAMTQRTVITLAELTDTANYPTNHTDTATNLGGGYFNAGTINDPYIMKALNKIRNRIFLDTNGNVEEQDLILVVNPDTANRMAQSQEIRAYLAQQAGSLAQLQGGEPSQVAGLPNPLYGFRVVIENAMRVAKLPGETDETVPSYCLGNTTALVVARPGALTSTAGGMNFSTCHILAYAEEEFISEVYDDARNKLVQVNLTDNYTPKVVAPESGFLITGVFAS